jgi:hypothetical protein
MLLLQLLVMLLQLLSLLAGVYEFIGRGGDSSGGRTGVCWAIDGGVP